MTHQTGNFLVPQHSGEPESKPKKIRCRQCGKNALENLVICPYCGRELYPAASRWLVWGAPVTLVLLFLIVMTTWGQTNPIVWTSEQLSGGRMLLTNVVRRIEPRLVSGNPTAAEAAIVAEPNNAAAVSADIAAGALEGAEEGTGEGVQVIEIAPETPTQPAEQAQTLGIEAATPTSEPTLVPETLVSESASSEFDASESATVPVPTETPEPTLTPEPTAVETATLTAPTRAVSVAQLLATSPASPTATDDSEETSAATAQRTGTATSASTTSAAATNTPTEAATATSTATSTATPTATPTVAPTLPPTPQLLTYEIQAGDTLLAIASQFGITVDELMAANNLTQSDVLALRPGQELIIPGQSAGSGSGQSSSAGTEQLQTYTVQSGDTPSSIARRFGVSVDALLSVNGLSQADATRLRTGQVLLIPNSSSDASSSTGAASAAPTSTPIPAESAASADAIRLDSPVLRTPQNGEALQCSRSNSLVWNPTPFITLQDNYVLHLGYVSALGENGEAQVQWVLAQESDSTRTSWEMDSEYCALAPQELGREWRWYVEVVDESGATISPPSEIWAFTWN